MDYAHKLTKRAFERECYRGLTYYESGSKKPVRIEQCTGSIELGRTDIIQCFLTFLNHFNRKYHEYCRGSYNIQFAVTFVNNQHFHMFWRKPFYVSPSEFQSVWLKVTNSHSHIYNRTVKGKKDNPKTMEKLVTYHVNQDFHHSTDTGDAYCEYYVSDFWGYKMAKNRSSTQSKNTRLSLRSSFQYQESYIIDGNFVDKQTFDKYMKDHPPKPILSKRQYPVIPPFPNKKVP